MIDGPSSVMAHKAAKLLETITNIIVAKKKGRYPIQYFTLKAININFKIYVTFIIDGNVQSFIKNYKRTICTAFQCHQSNHSSDNFAFHQSILSTKENALIDEASYDFRARFPFASLFPPSHLQKLHFSSNHL